MITKNHEKIKNFPDNISSLTIFILFAVHRFYCRAIKMNTSDLSLWYELALNYFKRSIIYGTDETRRKYLELASEAAKHIIKGAPHKWKYWNLLGVICTTKGKFENFQIIAPIFIEIIHII